MKHKILTVMLVMSLLGAGSGPAAAGVLGYSMHGAEKFQDKPPAEPSASVVMFDALLARPLGLGLTIGGTGLFLVTLPFSVPSGSVENAARGLIVKPGGYTFVRPLGRSDARFEEKGIFPQTLGSGSGDQQR